MKNTLSLIINAILGIAVVVLFVLHFSGSDSEDVKSGKKPFKSESDSLKPAGDISIAYIQIDTLLENMLMYNDLSEQLANRQSQLESNFSSKYRNFEKDVNVFQEEIQKQLITRREMQIKEQELANRRMELENERNNYLMQLQEENAVSQNKVISYIMDYLKEFNSDGEYQYIFSYSFGGGVLYATEYLDITDEVLIGINQKYREEKESE